MRRAHYLRFNQKKETPNRCIWVDTETDEVRIDSDTVKHVLRFGVAAYRSKNRHGNWNAAQWLYFSDTRQLWTWVEDKLKGRRRTYLFVHNTNFDLPVLHAFSELPERGWTCETAIVDGPPTILTFRRSPHTLTILDTLNIWRMPLAKLGQHVGLPKLEMPVGIKDQEVWNTYARRDVEIIMVACLAWFKFISDSDLGNFAPTLASQAMTVFKHRYLKHAILVSDNENELDLARAAYHGGRVECGFIGSLEGEFYLMDVNSMYPSVMRNYPMPTRALYYTEDMSVLGLVRALQGNCVIAEVDIDTRVAAFPVLRNHKLIFPVGRFKCALSTPELLYAIAHGALTKVHQATVYHQEIIFREFVDEFYARRMECETHGDSTLSWFFKILMNSLYGKFGQNGRKWQLIGPANPELPDVITWVHHKTRDGLKVRQFAGIMQALQVEGESAESIPSIAAHICAHARMELFQIIMDVGPENYFYCDTDAVITTAKGLQRILHRIDATGLGKLKQVIKFSHLEIKGLKDLVMDDRIVRKGIRKSAVEISPGVFRQERWSSIVGLISEGCLDFPLVKTITKHLRRSYDKGVVNASGFVSPFHLNEW